jgi:hypothetical protein
VSTATDFELIPLSENDLKHYEHLRARGYIACSSSTPKKPCREPIIYAGTYTYESSKLTRRRTRARRSYCEQHGREWAARHGATVWASPSESPANQFAASQSDEKIKQGETHARD